MGPTEIQKFPRKTFIQRSGKMNKTPKSVKRSLNFSASARKLLLAGRKKARVGGSERGLIGGGSYQGLALRVYVALWIFPARRYLTMT